MYNQLVEETITIRRRPYASAADVHEAHRVTDELRLALMLSPEMMHAIMPHLHSDNFEESLTTASLIGDIANIVTIQFLTYQLRDANQEQRVNISLALVWANWPDALPHLLDGLTAEHADTRKKAALGLSPHHNPSTMAPLMAALHDDDAQVRQIVVRVLGKSCNPAVAPALMDILQHDASDAVRGEAAEALGDCKDPAVFPVLQEAAHDASPEVRKGAVCGLEWLGDPRGVPVMIDLLHDPECAVRAAAAYSLGDMRDQRAVQPLLAVAASDPDEDVRQFAHEALGELHYY